MIFDRKNVKKLLTDVILYVLVIEKVSKKYYYIISKL